MKIHLIHYQYSQETQPIDLENIFTIGIISVRDDMNNGNYIWGHSFYIVPKIGSSITISTKVSGFVRKNSPEAEEDRKFLTNERNKLIEAWSKQ